MDWNSSALWGIIGLIGGFLFSFIFYKLSSKNKKIMFSKNSQVLITDTLSNIKDLNITYQNQPIKNLTSTTITIKSTEKDIIQMNDFGTATPFCIKTTGQFFLPNDINSIINKNSNPNNLMKPVIKDNTTILLDFDYLSQYDELEFILLHTGIVDIGGKLKSGNLFNKNNSKKLDLFSSDNTPWTFMFLALFMQMLLLIENSNTAFTNMSYFTFSLGLSTFIINHFQKYGKNLNK